MRLRTDDLKGFRKYESIKKTLLHELVSYIFTSFSLCAHILRGYIICLQKLCVVYAYDYMIWCYGFRGLIVFLYSFQAHMVYSEHDANFYALDKQVKKKWCSYVRVCMFRLPWLFPP